MSFATMENVPPIGVGLFNAMRMVLPKGGTVLELGSGEGSTTELKNAGYNVISVEHNGTYLGKWNDVEHTIFAPLNPGKFYDVDKLRAGILEKLPNGYDILLVDGPDTESRNFDLLEYGIGLFRPDVIWFFDDWAGDQMSMGIKAIANKTGRTLLTFNDEIKQYAVLLPEGR